MEQYPIVPGRSLVTPSATQLRLEFLQTLGIDTSQMANHHLQLPDVQNKIESFIGSAEIPIGLVGPLLFNDENREELVYGAAATLEGALVASMNRGAKAVSLSGGFRATIVHQKMLRCPMFLFDSEAHAQVFAHWVPRQFAEIKEEAEKHSNHAILTEVEVVKQNKAIHTRFYFHTGDASGQNMTTTCTWHAMLWMVAQFKQDTQIPISYYVIEGNGASDKKVSSCAVTQGRGIHVWAECTLQENVIEKVLRTSSANIYRCFGPSKDLALQDGMFGYNINVANAVAAIFAATGQDLGSIHESAVAHLHLEKVPEGLYLKLCLPTLVVGTVGGGTALPKQSEALKLMQCHGKGKVLRFAKLIAGFALSLEISTYAAIVSGEFAKAHEKLGRNKPVKWLTRAELTESFINKILQRSQPACHPLRVQVTQTEIENGIITNLTGRNTQKLLGFLKISVSDEEATKTLLLKSKALDRDVIKGLHSMAASIDPQLSDLINTCQDHLEYKNCHIKELLIYEHLSQSGFTMMPRFEGMHIDADREIYLLITECLLEDQMLLFNSENHPELWNRPLILACLEAINLAHQLLAPLENVEAYTNFKVEASEALYLKLIEIILKEEEDPGSRQRLEQLVTYLNDIKDRSQINMLPQVLIHNDFNPRNVAIRQDGKPCIYDWELAMVHIPHRDIVEFLCFVCKPELATEEVMQYFQYHSELFGRNLSDNSWLNGYIYALKEFLVCRMSFYKAAEILMKLKFPGRVMDNAFKFLHLLEQVPNHHKKLTDAIPIQQM